jgi:hypothetical protein
MGSTHTVALNNRVSLPRVGLGVLLVLLLVDTAAGCGGAPVASPAGDALDPASALEISVRRCKDRLEHARDDLARLDPRFQTATIFWRCPWDCEVWLSVPASADNVLDGWRIGYGWYVSIPLGEKVPDEPTAAGPNGWRYLTSDQPPTDWIRRVEDGRGAGVFAPRRQDDNARRILDKARRVLDQCLADHEHRR